MSLLAKVKVKLLTVVAVLFLVGGIASADSVNSVTILDTDVPTVQVDLNLTECTTPREPVTLATTLYPDDVIIQVFTNAAELDCTEETNYVLDTVVSPPDGDVYSVSVFLMEGYPTPNSSVVTVDQNMLMTMDDSNSTIEDPDAEPSISLKITPSVINLRSGTPHITAMIHSDSDYRASDFDHDSISLSVSGDGGSAGPLSPSRVNYGNSGRHIVAFFDSGPIFAALAADSGGDSGEEGDTGIDDGGDAEEKFARAAGDGECDGDGVCDGTGDGEPDEDGEPAGSSVASFTVTGSLTDGTSFTLEDTVAVKGSLKENGNNGNGNGNGKPDNPGNGNGNGKPENPGNGNGNGKPENPGNSGNNGNNGNGNGNGNKPNKK